MSIERERHPVRNALIASTIVMAGVHSYIERYTNDGHGPRVDLDGLGLFLDDETHTIKHPDIYDGDRYVDYASTKLTVPGETTEEGTVGSGVIEAAYARKFSADPHAKEQERQVAIDTAKKVEALQADGWTVSVEVQGFASAEDESTDPLGGIKTPSQNNVDLANLRREVAIWTLVQNGVDPDLIKRIEGQEDQLTGGEVLILEELQANHIDKYATIRDMIDAYNLDPASVPEDVHDQLYRYLNANRFAAPRIVANRQKVLPDGTVTQTNEICVIPMAHRIERATNTKPSDSDHTITIPWILLVTGAAGLVAAAGSEAARASKESRRSREAYEAYLATLPNVVTKPTTVNVPTPEVTTPDLSLGKGCLLFWAEVLPVRGRRKKTEIDPPGLPGSSIIDTTIVEPPTDGEPAVETIVDPPQDPEAPEAVRERRRRKWPYIIAPLILISGGLTMAKGHKHHHTNDPTPSQPVPPLTTIVPVDPCDGLDQVVKITGTQKVVTYNGMIQSTTFEPAS